jgi:hypothetical protein
MSTVTYETNGPLALTMTHGADHTPAPTHVRQSKHGRMGAAPALIRC